MRAQRLRLLDHFERHRTHLMDKDREGVPFFRRARPHEERQPLRKWIRAEREQLRRLIQGEMSEPSGEPLNFFDTSNDRIRQREEGIPRIDIEEEIMRKLNELRTDMYYDPDVDAIFYFSQDSVTKEEDVPSYSSSEESTATSARGILIFFSIHIMA